MLGVRLRLERTPLIFSYRPAQFYGVRNMHMDCEVASIDFPPDVTRAAGAFLFSRNPKTPLNEHRAKNFRAFANKLSLLVTKIILCLNFVFSRIFLGRPGQFLAKLNSGTTQYINHLPSSRMYNLPLT